MKTIGVLRNTIQEYAWGSHTAISELLGNPGPSKNPQAELWMGAHPKSPSEVYYQNQWISLKELIEKHPIDMLGENTADKYNHQLPYLFKVLAAEKPLSIQAHPNRLQAKEGFERENRLGIPLDAAYRNYKDIHHKPECICALTPFWALCGFRPVNEISALIAKICPNSLRSEQQYLRENPNPEGLRFFFTELMKMGQERRKAVVDMAVRHALTFSENNDIFQWMIKLYDVYPDDIGVFSPVLLNLICLEPGEAMFLPAGELHAYLNGVGIELMANSDNVLRGGLTPKHVDVNELLNVLTFETHGIKLLTPHPAEGAEAIYESSAEEFVLSVITVGGKTTYIAPTNRSIEILLCTEGEAKVFEDAEITTGLPAISVSKGSSFVIPAAVKDYTIKGNAVFYKASVAP